jgi:hypothetical protein
MIAAFMGMVYITACPQSMKARCVARAGLLCAMSYSAERPTRAIDGE